MKSAYELAMERLAAKDGDRKVVTEEQKAKLAEIDEKYRAKIAEREVFLTPKLAAAEASGNLSEAADLRKQIAHERARLEEEREAKKDAVRGEA
ncbi:hypothetical protein IEN85_05680 [Pelagicoccus sp. NFK12]|uniref:Uncharacterized protein n=1 Tax=Pelagicoccus enzymogenes TaxID=2773457 RepID=A0A927F6N7_9BACT|nr:hypothetical protein [Pelagicoccus enzymogenes]MBD5778975.1 hypothetical protein [Pelagicoccus enzymogenes]MDQ8197281.1 hypothetical protein [Pelagicoccus enzymogenes]